MAERRMFSKTIVDSDLFLDMPLSTQCLYFHLNMRADDDGFINNPKRIMRMIGSNDDDLRLLMLKEFIFTFESGVVVVKHWKIHNYIRNDRYKETKYLEEKQQIEEKTNKTYALKNQVSNNVIDINDNDIGIPNGYQMDTQVRLGKVRLGKDIKTSCMPLAHDKKIKEDYFNEFWNLYPRKLNTKKSKEIFLKKCTDETVFKEIIDGLKKHVEIEWRDKEIQFIPHATTWLNQERYKDEIVEKTKKGVTTLETPKYFNDQESEEEKESRKALESWLNS